MVALVLKPAVLGGFERAQKLAVWAHQQGMLVCAYAAAGAAVLPSPLPPPHLLPGFGTLRPFGFFLGQIHCGKGSLAWIVVRTPAGLNNVELCAGCN